MSALPLHFDDVAWGDMGRLDEDGLSEIQSLLTELAFSSTVGKPYWYDPAEDVQSYYIKGKRYAVIFAYIGETEPEEVLVLGVGTLDELLIPPDPEDWPEE
jgi:hypothetical protein